MQIIKKSNKNMMVLEAQEILDMMCERIKYHGAEIINMKLDKIQAVENGKDCMKKFIQTYWDTKNCDILAFIDLDGKLKIVK